MMAPPIAITGAGAVTPLGSSPARWARDGAAEVQAGGMIGDIGLGRLPEPVRVRAGRAERVTQLLFAAAGPALAAAGLDATAGAIRPRIGVVVGTAFGCFLTNSGYQRRLAEVGPAAASPRLFAATVSNAAAGELGIAYRLGGPAVTLTAGAASGLTALAHAVDLLRAGAADAVLAAGVDALGAPLARWLDAGGLAAGRTVAEGAAAVVLERADAAASRGATTLGLIVGVAGGFEPGPAAPDAGAGLAAAVAAALAEAGVGPGDVGAVVCAAPPALAALEERALAAALRDACPRRTRPKDVVGETFGAAGPLGLLAALAEAPPGATALVLDVCASGHVAALVARRGGAA
jgi:3-oxoacyl-[acyl-carrier-protein] synthase II